MLVGESSEITLWINNVFGPVVPLDDAALSEFLATFVPAEQQALHTKTYTFLGPVALQYAAALCLADRYQRLGVDLLASVKSMLDRGLLRFMATTLQVPAAGDEKNADTVLAACIGVMHALHGMDTVQRFVAGFIEEHRLVLFRTLPRSIKQQLDIPKKNRVLATPRRKSSQINADTDTDNMSVAQPVRGPLQQLHEMIMHKGGSFEWRSSDRFAMGRHEWGERVVFKMAAHARLRYHERFGTSKRKAKTSTAMDIAAYYKSHPDQLELDYQPVDAPGEPEALPITEDTYATDIAPPELVESKDNLSISSSSSSGNGNGNSNGNDNIHTSTDHPNRIHIAEKRGYDDESGSVEEQLMDILLNFDNQCEVDVNTTTTKKRKASNEVDTWYKPLPTRVLTDLEAMRLRLDMSRIERMYTDPVQYVNPKSSLHSYIHNLQGLEMRTTYTESGPPHQRVFEASTVLSAPADRLQVMTVGEGSRKSDAEMVAIREMLKLLLAI